MTAMPLREPTVDEMLADPIVQLVMRRDGVEEEEVRRILRQTARARAERLGRQAFAAEGETALPLAGAA